MGPCFECQHRVAENSYNIFDGARAVPLCRICAARLGVRIAPVEQRPQAGWPKGRWKKISPEVAAIIIARRAEGRTFREIAKELSLSLGSLHRFFVRVSKIG